MRKLLFFLCALLTGVNTMWAQSDPVTLTFNHDTSQTAANAEVAVNVAGIEGVSATFQQLSNYPYANGALVTNAILCPNVNRNATPTIQYQITLTGMPADYTFNTYAMYVHAFAGAGSSYQQSLGRTWDVSVQIDGEDFVSDPALDVCKDLVFQQTHTLRSETSKTAENGTLKLLLIVKGPDAGVGCFFGLESITLSNMNMTQATYKLMYGDEEVFSETVEAELNTDPVLSIPASFQNAYCDLACFSDQSCTTSVTSIEENATIYVNAALKEEGLPFEFFTSKESAKWYTMKIRNTYSVFVGESEPYVPSNAVSESAKLDENYHWAFSGNPYRVAVYNKSTEEKTLTRDGDGDTGNAVMRDGTTYWVLGKNNSGFTLKEVDSNSYINHNGSAKLGFWTNGSAAGDGGSAFIVEEAKTLDEAITSYMTQDKIANVNNAGQYGYPKTSTTTYQSIKEVVDKLNTGNATWTIEDFNNMVAYYDAYLAETDIVVPEAGKFYHIYAYNSAGNKFLLASGNKIIGRRTTEETLSNDASSIWYLDENNKLTVFSSGYQYAGTTDNVNVMGHEGGTEVAFVRCPSAFGKVSIRSNGKLWFIQASEADDKDLTTDSSNGSYLGAQFYIGEVNALPITISEAGLATFYSPVAVTVPEDVTAYTGEISADGAALNLTPVEGTIPANTAVVLEGEGEVSLPIAEAASVAETENGAFTGTISTIATPEETEILTLQNRDGKPGFYPYNGETLAGFKAYLTMSAPAEVKGVDLNFGMTDAIREIVKDGQQAEAVYDLTGRRVEKAVKGIYIVNGKKTVIK